MKRFLLAILFVIGMLAGCAIAIFIFFRSLMRGARAFHPDGTMCRAELVALDDVVGPRLAGPALVRVSGSSAPENSPDHTILGMAMKIGGDQDLPLASFESFLHASDATKATNVADYLGNQYASVAPWVARGLGVVWFRAMPGEQPATKTGTRVERLVADIAAGRAVFTLEARVAAGPDGALRARVAELRLVERLPADDPKFKISMFRTARGLSPTGFRNGVRAIAYPTSQLARGLRGH
jgi:hypothetical protein